MTTYPSAPPPAYEEKSKEGEGGFPGPFPIMPRFGSGIPGAPAPFLAGGDWTSPAAQPGYPATQPGYPATQPGYPAAQPGYPATQPGYPATQPGYPATQPGYAPQGGYPEGGYPQSGYNSAPAYPSTAFNDPNYPGMGSGGFKDVGYSGDDSGGILDPTSSNNFGTSFENKNIRRLFIRKVYLILMLQLSVTTAFICIFVFDSSVKLFVRRNTWIYIVSYVTFFITYLVLVCCPSVRRKWPTNFIMLAVLTLAMSFMMGTISSYHDFKIVLMAIGIAAGTCLAVTLFSIQTKWDFTSCGGVLFVISIVILLFGICALVLWRTQAGPILHAVYAGLFGLLFMGYLAYDTQLLIGGRRHEISAEEHIFCAIQLYLDVVYIFLSLLQLIGFFSKS